MPTTKSYGTKSEANKAIGGIPTIHYFDFQSRGRGQVLRLMLIDAGAAYIDIRYTFSEWAANRSNDVETQITKLNPMGSMPVVEMPDGQVLTQSYAILRHWARLLGKYDGADEEERYWVDGVCDVIVDWRTQFLAAYFSPNPTTDLPIWQTTRRPRFLNGMEKKLASPRSSNGPFINGKEITYADFVLYQILHDEELTKDGEGLVDYPRLRAVVDAVEGRENVKMWLGSEDYLG